MRLNIFIFTFLKITYKFLIGMTKKGELILSTSIQNKIVEVGEQEGEIDEHGNEIPYQSKSNSNF